MDDLGKQIGQQARAARQELGLTQAEVAEEVGVATEVYGRIERGVSLPSLPTLVAIAEALEIPPGQLLEIKLPKLRKNPSSAEATRVAALLEGADKATRKLVLQLTKALVAKGR